MKSLTESIQESLNINESKYKLEYPILTWNLVDIYQECNTLTEVSDWLMDNAPDIDGLSEDFYLDLFGLIFKYKGYVHKFDGGNLYPDTTMRDLLVELGAIEKGEYGFVLKKDGDDAISTICTFDKKMSATDKKKLKALIDEYRSNSSMMIAEIF